MSQFDVVVRGGMVFDGSGTTPRYRADIGIRSGVIAEIGRIPASDGARVLDADGLHVAPGAIDVHTHYDAQLFWDPWCSTSGWHGVTSAAIGNCGFGFAPVAPELRERSMLSMTKNEAIPLTCMKEGMPWDWVTFPEFLDSIERTPKAVNVVPMLPLGPLMIWVMGLERAKAGEMPTDEEHAEMCRLLDEALEVGACGFTAQRAGHRSPQPDYDGTPMVTDIMHHETMLALAGVLARRNQGAIQYTYGDLTGRSRHEPEIRRHFEEVAKVSGRPLMPPWAFGRQEWARHCQARGLRIYPQDAGQIALSPKISTSFTMADEFVFICATSQKFTQTFLGTTAERLARVADPDVRASLKNEPLYELPLTVLLRGATPETARFDETRLDHIAAELGKDVVDTFFDILLADGLQTKFYFEQPKARFSSAQRREMLSDGSVLWGVSDGGAHTRYLNSGTWPTTFLIQEREHGWIGLEETHRRMSAWPAQIFGLRNRGVVREGAAADLMIYDLDNLAMGPEEVAHDFPGGEWRLTKRAEGYRWVLVNGKVILEDGAQTEADTAGALLRSGR